MQQGLGKHTQTISKYSTSCQTWHDREGTVCVCFTVFCCNKFNYLKMLQSLRHLKPGLTATAQKDNDCKKM